MQIFGILLAVLCSRSVFAARIPWKDSNPNEGDVVARWKNTTIPDVREKLESSTIVPAPNNAKEQYSDNRDLSISDYSFSRKINKDSDTDSSFVQEDDQQLTDINGSDDEGEKPISDYSSSEDGEKPVYNSNGSDEGGEQPILETSFVEEGKTRVSNEQLAPGAISSGEVVNETSSDDNRPGDVSDQQGSDVSSSYEGSNQLNPDGIFFGEADGKPRSDSNSSAEGTSDINRSTDGGQLNPDGIFFGEADGKPRSDSNSSAEGTSGTNRSTDGGQLNPDGIFFGEADGKPGSDSNSSAEGTSDTNKSADRGDLLDFDSSSSGEGDIPDPHVSAGASEQSVFETSSSDEIDNNPSGSRYKQPVTPNNPSGYGTNHPVPQPVATRVVNVLSGYGSSPSSNKENRPFRVEPPTRPTRKQIPEPFKSKLIKGLNKGLYKILEAIRKNRAYGRPVLDQLFQQVRSFSLSIKANGGEVDERNKRLMEYLLPQHLKEALGS